MEGREVWKKRRRKKVAHPTLYEGATSLLVLVVF